MRDGEDPILGATGRQGARPAASWAREKLLGFRGGYGANLNRIRQGRDIIAYDRSWKGRPG
jgi:hypothetical protein